MYIPSTATTALINVKLTEKGRELLASGFKEDNVFDITKFAFGDTEIDYRITGITGTSITYPSVGNVDLSSKLYSFGTIPSGNSVVTLSNSNVNMTKHQGNKVITVETDWPPIRGVYLETYKWTNLGPLSDYDFILRPTKDTRSATIATYDITGSTTIKVEGQISGKYNTFILTIND